MLFIKKHTLICWKQQSSFRIPQRRTPFLLSVLMRTLRLSLNSERLVLAHVRRLSHWYRISRRKQSSPQCLADFNLGFNPSHAFLVVQPSVACRVGSRISWKGSGLEVGRGQFEFEKFTCRVGSKSKGFCHRISTLEIVSVCFAVKTDEHVRMAGVWIPLDSQSWIARTRYVWHMTNVPICPESNWCCITFWRLMRFRREPVKLTTWPSLSGILWANNNARHRLARMWHAKVLHFIKDTFLRFTQHQQAICACVCLSWLRFSEPLNLVRYTGCLCIQRQIYSRPTFHEIPRVHSSHSFCYKIFITYGLQ